MSRKWLQLGVVFGVMACLVFAVACGGGGGGGGAGTTVTTSSSVADAVASITGAADIVTGSTGVTALDIPDRIAMTSASYPSASTKSMAAGAYAEPGTDYTNQEKDSWADDGETLDMVNQILEAINGTAYESFVNAGPYLALVEKVGDADESQGGSSTTNTTVEELQELIVDVTRADENSPMIAKIWVEEEDGPGGAKMLIKGLIIVVEGVSSTYPYGRLEAHFAGEPLEEGATDTEVFTMAMSIDADADGNVVVEFIDEGGDSDHHCSWIEKARVITNADLSAGKAYAYETETRPDWDTGDPVTEVFTEYIAYDDDYFKISEDGVIEVLDKDNLERQIFRYKLFLESDGSAVDMSSGFPLRLATGEHAYVGYWGLWAPYGVTVAHGDTVTSEETDVEYTVFRVGGKLTKHTRAYTTLDKIAGVEMSFWQWNDVTETGAEYIIAWDSTAEAFMKIGERNQNNWQATYYAEADQTEITFANEWDGAWCESLRAYLRLGSLGATPGNTTELSYHKETTMGPGDIAADMTLYCWEYVPEFPMTQEIMNGAMAAQEATWGTTATVKTLTFDVSEMTLLDPDGDAMIIGSDITMMAPFDWGFHIGPLTPDVYTADNHWNIYDTADIYYTWQSGTDEWTQFTSLQDAEGDFVEFDAPLQFTYEHETANDANEDPANNGKVFSMDYDGFSLCIPWVFDEAENEWNPTLNLEDGTVLTAGGVNYVVKGVEEDLVMESVADTSVADYLTVDTTIAVPTLEYDATKTALVGDQPTGVELKVIKGEVIP